MPYNNEFAKSKGIQKLLRSEEMKQTLEVVQFIITDNDYERIDTYTLDKKITPKDCALEHVFVIDGSKLETSPEGSQAKLCLFSVDQCVIDLNKLVAYLKEPFPLPKKYKEISEDLIVNAFLPLKGMRTKQQPTEGEFFRSTLFNMLRLMENPINTWLTAHGYMAGKETLLETYFRLLNRYDSIKGKVNIHHPCAECRRNGKMLGLKSFKKETGGFHAEIYCACEENPKLVYPTDLMGFHEQLGSETSNEALTTQVMLVLERLIMMNSVIALSEPQNHVLIPKSMFLLDGALAVYSHASWISQGIHRELMDLREQGLNYLIAGIEKTGNFVDHFKMIDKHFAIAPLKNQMLYYLEDSYIKEVIKASDNTEFYGEHNYFGKKFFYKNRKGKLFVMNLAFEDDKDRAADFNERNNEAYRQRQSRIEDILMILDNFASQSYDNALSLISMANDGASLSSSYMSKKLVTDYIQSLINGR